LSSIVGNSYVYVYLGKNIAPTEPQRGSFNYEICGTKENSATMYRLWLNASHHALDEQLIISGKKV